MAITLYRIEGCPPCEAVVDALEELGVEFQSVRVRRRHSERNTVREVTGRRRVPALVDDAHGVTMSQPTRIVEYLETTYGDE